MTKSNKLIELQREMQMLYGLYKAGLLSEWAYLDAIRPLDRQIDSIELSYLFCYVISKESDSKLSHAPKNLQALPCNS